MELILKIDDGLDVITSVLDSSKSNVFVRKDGYVDLKLFDSTGNLILHVSNI